MNSCNRSLELIKNYLNFHIFAYIGAIITFQSESQFFSLIKVCDQCLDRVYTDTCERGSDFVDKLL